jgi:hypothetical protein
MQANKTRKSGVGAEKAYFVDFFMHNTIGVQRLKNYQQIP